MMDKHEMHIQSNFGEDPKGYCPVNSSDPFKTA